jgi:hypothetical protein
MSVSYNDVARPATDNDCGTTTASRINSPAADLSVVVAAGVVFVAGDFVGMGVATAEDEAATGDLALGVSVLLGGGVVFFGAAAVKIGSDGTGG